MALFDTWLKSNKKQIAILERESPLRNELFWRILIFAIAALALQFGLLWWAGVRVWGHGSYLFGSLPFSIALLLVAIVVRKRYPPLALAPLFFAIVSTVVLPIEQAAKGLYEYPEFSGALLLTILLSGLMMGNRLYASGLPSASCFSSPRPRLAGKPMHFGICCSWQLAGWSRCIRAICSGYSRSAAPPRSSSETRLSPSARVSHGTFMIRWRKVSPAS